MDVLERSGIVLLWIGIGIWSPGLWEREALSEIPWVSSTSSIKRFSTASFLSTLPSSSSSKALSTRVVTLPSHGSLFLTLKAAGISKKEMTPFLRVIPRHYLSVGQKVKLLYQENALAQVKVFLDFAGVFEAVLLKNGTCKGTVKKVPIDSQFVRVQGKVAHNLFTALTAKKVSHPMAVSLVRAMSKAGIPWRFGQGTNFSILYKQFYNPKSAAVMLDQLCLVRLEHKGKQRSFYGYKTPGSAVPKFYSNTGVLCRSENGHGERFCQPLQSCRISSFFGRRYHPILRTWRNHKGVDFSAPSGTPVFAAACGMVEEKRVRFGYGHYVRIRHDNDYCTAYAHLRGYARGLKVGQRVAQGQVIGYVGRSGYATASHLHFELLKGRNCPINPLKVVRMNRIKECLIGKEKSAFYAYVKGLWRVYGRLHLQ